MSYVTELLKFLQCHLILFHNQISLIIFHICSTNTLSKTWIQFGATHCSRLNLFIYSCLFFFFFNDTDMVNTQIISLPSGFVVSFSTLFCPLESCKLGVKAWLLNINHLGLDCILYEIYIYIYIIMHSETSYLVAISSVIPRIIIFWSLYYTVTFPFLPENHLWWYFGTIKCSIQCYNRPERLDSQ